MYVREAGGIIRPSCVGGVSVLSAGKSGLFYPHEGLIGSDPEVCSVVVSASSKLRCALSSQECTLLDSCRAAAARYPISHHMAAVRLRWWESAALPHVGTSMEVTEVNPVTLSCVGLCSCRVSSKLTHAVLF